MLNEVLKDPVIRNAINYIDLSKLNRYYRMMYNGIKGGSGCSVYFSYIKDYFKYEIYKPLVRKLVNTKIFGKSK